MHADRAIINRGAVKDPVAINRAMPVDRAMIINAMPIDRAAGVKAMTMRAMAAPLHIGYRCARSIIHHACCAAGQRCRTRWHQHYGTENGD
jgi:hypothetical protein